MRSEVNFISERSAICFFRIRSSKYRHSHNSHRHIDGAVVSKKSSMVAPSF